MVIYRQLWPVVGSEDEVRRGYVEVTTKSGKVKREKVVSVIRLANGQVLGITEKALADIQKPPRFREPDFV